MPCRRTWSVQIAIALLFVNAAFAQKSHSGNRDSRVRHKVSLQVRLSQDGYHAGSDVLAAVIAEIQEGWHINSSTPGDENFIETSLQVGTPKGIGIAYIGYPEGIERNFDFAAAPLNVYEGTQYIWVRLRLAPDLRPGSYTVPVVLGYQACSNNVCLAPATVSVDLRFHVVAADTKVSRIHKDIFDRFKEPDRE